MTLDILTVNDRSGEHTSSWYSATVGQLPAFAEAEGRVRADVCVVGGGYTGLSAALHLAKKGLDVVLLEAHRIGFGASGRNGGHVGTGMRQDQDWLEQKVGLKRAKELWGLGLEAVELVGDLAGQGARDCEFTRGIVHADHRKRYVADTHGYVRKLNEDYEYPKIRALGREEIQEIVGSPDYHGGSLDEGAAHIHPLRFAVTLGEQATAAGVKIFENSRVVSIDKGATVSVKTTKAEVQADHLVLACNGYLGGLEPQVAARVMPINNFIGATRPLSDAERRIILRKNVAVSDSRFVVNYFRMSSDNRLLFGGGESYGYRFPRDLDGIVRKPMSIVYPHLADIDFDFTWGGTLAITMTRMPYFKRISGNILSASGYSGHGVPIATLAGKLIAEAVAGQAGRFDLMAQVPTPMFPGGARLRHPLLVLGMIWFAMRDRL
ncbi:MAG: FAD-binding oxidoreductase [Paracoccaceae bacterium]|nr:FAD-binding oxidoreductase [Paracoccaceae bacterium]